MIRTPFTIAGLLLITQLAGCSTDPVQQAYDDCMAEVSAGKTETSNDAMKGMIEGIQKMAESACGMILSTCEADRESAMCQSMVSKYVESE